MTPSVPGYGLESLVRGCREAGLLQDDVVFVHVNLDGLGAPEEGIVRADLPRLLLQALREVVGEEGTILLPTYTFSFCRQEVFDRQDTATAGGPWSPSADVLEWFRRLPGVIRSSDPIHSVAGQGPRARALLEDVAPTCFGTGSVFHRLLQAEGKICLIGLPLEEATFRHYTEGLVGVPFRFRKLFTGVVRDQGISRKQGWVYNVRLMADSAYPDGTGLEREARRQGVCRAVPVGSGEVLLVEAQGYHRLTSELLHADAWSTARGPAGDPVALEEARVGSCRPTVALRPGGTMADMIAALWRSAAPRLRRVRRRPGRVDDQLPMRIHEYPSGLECWSWIIPEKWNCHEAYLETLDGRRLFSHGGPSPSCRVVFAGV